MPAGQTIIKENVSMEKEDFDLLGALLKQVARHVVNALLEKIRNAGRNAWAAIKRAATAAMLWITAACKAIGRRARECVLVIRRTLKEIAVKCQAMLAKLGPAAA